MNNFQLNTFLQLSQGKALKAGRGSNICPVPGRWRLLTCLYDISELFFNRWCVFRSSNIFCEQNV